MVSNFFENETCESINNFIYPTSLYIINSYYRKCTDLKRTSLREPARMYFDISMEIAHTFLHFSRQRSALEHHGVIIRIAEIESIVQHTVEFIISSQPYPISTLNVMFSMVQH